MNENIKNESGNKKRIALFVKQGLDGFADIVIDVLSGWMETKKYVVTDLGLIDEGMEWADLCWFEWCDELIAYASRNAKAAKKKIICRLHGYEAFTDFPAQVNWETVDLLIFVADHIRDYMTEKDGIDIKTVVVPNAVDTEKCTFKKRAPGHSIAYAGYINHNKGPQLLLHTFKAIYDLDRRYKLYVAGLFQDERDLLYYEHMIKEWGLEENVFFDGWQEDLDGWLEDKNYILCTSMLEAQNSSVMQAMAKGIKPLIHNFVGAGGIYPENLLFNSIPEAVAMLGGPYASEEYREFVRTRYGKEETSKKLRQVIRDVAESGSKQPLVSVVMAVYNREKYVLDAIQSVLSQDYANIELIIVDDGSTDGTEGVIRAVQDPRIRYFAKEKNTGHLDTLRYGFTRAKGRFVTRVDSDDTIHSAYIAACVEAMSLDASLDFIYSDFLTIDDRGEAVGEVHFKDYDTPLRLIMDAFATFSSVIPDTSFWKKEYMEHVLLNSAGQNMPFYTDNILECRFGHIKSPMYRYRQHDANYAARIDNVKVVLEGKIKFIDILIKKYFIQMDVTKEFRENRQEYFRLFVRYFTLLAKAYEDAGEEIESLFLDEAAFWESFVERGGKEEAKQQEPDAARIKNRRVLLVSADDPGKGGSGNGKHAHMHLLIKGLKELGIPYFPAAYAFDPVTTVDGRMLVQEWGVPAGLLSEKDSAFACLVYAIQKQLEQKIEKRLKATFVSAISCQDVVAAHAARSVLSRLHMDIPLVTTVHGLFTLENTGYGLINANSEVYDFFLEYEKIAYAASNRVLAVDKRIRDYITDIAGKDAAKKTVILKKAVDDVLFHSDPAQKSFFDNGIIFVPGSHAHKNGAIQAVDAARELKRKGVKGFRFVIAGDGAEQKEIEGYIEANGLQEYVELLGKVPHSRTLALYLAAKIVFIPFVHSESATEEVPVPALEAMSCGRAVAAANTDGTREIIEDGKNGYLVSPAGPAALADALAKILRMDIDAYETIGRNARRTVEENHGYRRLTQKYVEVYDACYSESVALERADL